MVKFARVALAAAAVLGVHASRRNTQFMDEPERKAEYAKTAAVMAEAEQQQAKNKANDAAAMQDEEGTDAAVVKHDVDMANQEDKTMDKENTDRGEFNSDMHSNAQALLQSQDEEDHELASAIEDEGIKIESGLNLGIVDEFPADAYPAASQSADDDLDAEEGKLNSDMHSNAQALLQLQDEEDHELAKGVEESEQGMEESEEGMESALQQAAHETPDEDGELSAEEQAASDELAAKESADSQTAGKESDSETATAEAQDDSVMQDEANEVEALEKKDVQALEKEEKVQDVEATEDEKPVSGVNEQESDMLGDISGEDHTFSTEGESEDAEGELSQPELIPEPELIPTEGQTVL